MSDKDLQIISLTKLPGNEPWILVHAINDKTFTNRFKTFSAADSFLKDLILAGYKTIKGFEPVLYPPEWLETGNPKDTDYWLNTIQWSMTALSYSNAPSDRRASCLAGLLRAAQGLFDKTVIADEIDKVAQKVKEITDRAKYATRYAEDASRYEVKTGETKPAN
jgi:hypothetical protein